MYDPHLITILIYISTSDDSAHTHLSMHLFPALNNDWPTGQEFPCTDNPRFPRRSNVQELKINEYCCVQKRQILTMRTSIMISSFCCHSCIAIDLNTFRLIEHKRESNYLKALQPVLQRHSTLFLLNCT